MFENRVPISPMAIKMAYSVLARVIAYHAGLVSYAYELSRKLEAK